MDPLAKVAFGEQSSLSDASAQQADAAFAVKHASNPLLKVFDSLQVILGTLNTQVMAAGFGRSYSLNPIQVLHVSMLQRKLIGQSGGDPDRYSLRLAEIMEKVSAYLRDQACPMWCHFLHLHCGFSQPDADFVRSDQERMNSDEDIEQSKHCTWLRSSILIHTRYVSRSWQEQPRIPS